ncbi:MAG: helix-turn-helix transcriptional regulator [Phocaeicola vulgatus]|nr:MAG: helix-turn-helix transcriptional regulator [Phocaeicola vulgatus]
MRCNLTQKDVSEQSGIGLTTIHKFENGTSWQYFIVNIYCVVESGRTD